MSVFKIGTQAEGNRFSANFLMIVDADISVPLSSNYEQSSSRGTLSQNKRVAITNSPPPQKNDGNQVRRNFHSANVHTLN